jgi:cell wall-associated NlpC family hydrolase
MMAYEMFLKNCNNRKNKFIILISLIVLLIFSIIYFSPGNASANIIYVTVKPGYTISQIASKYNTSVSSIMSANGLSNYNIYAGQKLKVVSGGAYVPQQPAVTYGHYVVKFGDTLSLIAQKYNTSISKLKNLNHLYSNVIRQGAILTVPESYKVAANKINHYNSNDKTATFEVLHKKVYNNSNNSPNSYKNNGSLGKKIVKVAFRYRGVPYVWGGTTRSGMDCSGFVQHVFKKLDISIPRTAQEQSRLGKYVPKNKLKPGMLLFFRTYAPYISHVGIYIGHGKFIQANSGAGKITVSSLSNEYFERTYAFAKSIK